MLQETVEFAASNDGKGSDVGLGVRSEEIKDVSHDALWRSMMISIREPARFYPCSGVSIKECSGFVQWTITAGSETYLENIYSDETSCEIIFRKLVNGAETDVECCRSRTHPLEIEFHQRNMPADSRCSRYAEVCCAELHRGIREGGQPHESRSR